MCGVTYTTSTLTCLSRGLGSTGCLFGGCHLKVQCPSYFRFPEEGIFEFCLLPLCKYKTRSERPNLKDVRLSISSRTFYEEVGLPPTSVILFLRSLPPRNGVGEEDSFSFTTSRKD